MPYSSSEGKREFMVPAVLSLLPGGRVTSVLDIGAGAGTYSDLLRPLLPRATFTGVEIFEPYVGRFNLRRKYDNLILGDALTLDFEQHDLVILGDVLEHVEYDQALELWDKVRRLAKRAVLLSLPIVVYEQGCVGGNEHEAHLYHWKHNELLETLPGIYQSFAGTEIGCYLAAPDEG